MSYIKKREEPTPKEEGQEPTSEEQGERKLKLRMLKIVAENNLKLTNEAKGTLNMLIIIFITYVIVGLAFLFQRNMMLNPTVLKASDIVGGLATGIAGLIGIVSSIKNTTDSISSKEKDATIGSEIEDKIVILSLQTEKDGYLIRAKNNIRKRNKNLRKIIAIRSLWVLIVCIALIIVIFLGLISDRIDRFDLSLTFVILGGCFLLESYTLRHSLENPEREPTCPVICTISYLFIYQFIMIMNGYIRVNVTGCCCKEFSLFFKIKICCRPLYILRVTFTEDEKENMERLLSGLKHKDYENNEDEKNEDKQADEAYSVVINS